MDYDNTAVGPLFFNKKNREGPHFFVMKYDGQMCSFRNHKNLLSKRHFSTQSFLQRKRQESIV